MATLRTCAFLLVLLAEASGSAMSLGNIGRTIALVYGTSAIVPEYSLLIDHGELVHGLSWVLEGYWRTEDEGSTEIPNRSHKHGVHASVSFYPGADAAVVGRLGYRYWFFRSRWVYLGLGPGIFFSGSQVGPRGDLCFRIGKTKFDGKKFVIGLFASAAYEYDAIENRHRAEMTAGITTPFPLDIF